MTVSDFWVKCTTSRLTVCHSTTLGLAPVVIDWSMQQSLAKGGTHTLETINHYRESSTGGDLRPRRRLKIFVDVQPNRLPKESVWFATVIWPHCIQGDSPFGELHLSPSFCRFDFRILPLLRFYRPSCTGLLYIYDTMLSTCSILRFDRCRFRVHIWKIF